MKKIKIQIKSTLRIEFFFGNLRTEKKQPKKKSEDYRKVLYLLHFHFLSSEYFSYIFLHFFTSEKIKESTSFVDIKNYHQSFLISDFFHLMDFFLLKSKGLSWKWNKKNWIIIKKFQVRKIMKILLWNHFRNVYLN